MAQAVHLAKSCWDSEWIQIDRCFDSGPKWFKEVFNEGLFAVFPIYHVNYIKSMLLKKVALKDLANTPDHLDIMDNVEVLMRMVVQLKSESGGRDK